jgi:hypothetical protein
MRRHASHLLVLLFAMQASVPLAQEINRPEPAFTLSIEEDKDATRINPDLHRVLVKFTRVAIGVEVEEFHEEAKGMYEIIVLRDGFRVRETDAMRDLRAFRRVDGQPTIRNPRFLETGQSWTTPLDVSDYYDMTKPGTYQVTVTRESLPFPGTLARSTTVKSNTVTILVPRRIGAQSSQAAEKPKPRFALDLAAANPDDVPPQWLQVKLENTSNGVIRERTCSSFMGMYDLFVSRNGDLLETNDEMRRLQQSRAAVDCSGNEAVIEIKPGEFYADGIPLSNFYDVEKPGSYVVYVTRETYPYNPAKSVLVESNSISFVVPEPPAGAAMPPANDAQPAQPPEQ